MEIRRAVDQHHVVAIAHGLDDVPQADLQVAGCGPRLRIVVLHGVPRVGHQIDPGNLRAVDDLLGHCIVRIDRGDGLARGEVAGGLRAEQPLGEAGLRVVIDQQNPLPLPWRGCPPSGGRSRSYPPRPSGSGARWRRQASTSHFPGKDREDLRPRRTNNPAAGALLGEGPAPP